nr:hypothetical protein Itr_chr14CG20920 [Ipomoea trifida]
MISITDQGAWEYHAGALPLILSNLVKGESGIKALSSSSSSSLDLGNPSELMGILGAGRRKLGLGSMGQAKAGLEAHMRPPAVGGAGGASGAPRGALVAPGHGADSAPRAGPHRGQAPPSRPVAGLEGVPRTMVVPPTEQLGGPAPGGNGGGDEVLVSVRIEREEVCAIHPAPDEWMQEMILYQKHGNTPNDSTRARKVVTRVVRIAWRRGDALRIAVAVRVPLGADWRDRAGRRGWCESRGCAAGRCGSPWPCGYRWARIGVIVRGDAGGANRVAEGRRAVAGRVPLALGADWRDRAGRRGWCESRGGGATRCGSLWPGGYRWATGADRRDRARKLGLGSMGQAKAGLEAHMRPPAVGGAGGASGAPRGALVAPGHGADSAPRAGPHRGQAPPFAPRRGAGGGVRLGDGV